MGYRVQGSGYRVQGTGFRVQGTGFRVQGSGYRVEGTGYSGFQASVSLPSIVVKKCKNFKRTI